MSIGIAIMGLLVGGLVGITGVGGAALLTPILMFLGISPSIAVGSDLMYNSITKFFGAIQHSRQKTVRWDIVRQLALGSIPGAITAVIILRFCQPVFHDQEKFMKVSLGYVLIFTACLTLYQALFHGKVRVLEDKIDAKTKVSVTIILGFVLGLIVGLTSVGSGSLFAIAMLFMYRILPSQLVGTDIVHAFFLVTISALLHAGIGKVDFLLVLNLIIGSVPGVVVGSKVSTLIPTKALKIVITLIILISGFKLLS
ncbi:sulfite exporter TauE/SafE family protein [Paenibacillus elgii]|uniref:Probable membrane transporter protein n=1 Tax=Paenibacillus elgii TaxID=189691 RepID=A0A2T6G6V9_9BACL|nr:sulfite exporter TauE/SafE family protein [Paenibacillus elgii]PUA39885.1 sulfite exporter TauE/SafE family protein [Paenibacillus elgii]